MRKVLPTLVGLVVFALVLEMSARAYLFSDHDRGAGQLVHSPAEIMKHWRGLPYEIPVSSGNMIRYTNGGEIVFDVPFSINPDSTRRSSQSGLQADRHLLFIGCSFTFGTGVRDDETLASSVAVSLPGVRSHNYGVLGASTIETVLRLRKIKPEEYPGKNNLVIYTYIGDHLRRHTMAIPYVGSWGREKIVFRQVGKDYEALGKYHEVFPVQAFLYGLLSNSGIFRLLYPFFDLRLSVEEKDGFVTSLGFLKEQSESVGAKFLVIIWPGTQTPGWLVKAMKDKGISNLNLSRINLRSLTKTPYIPIDSHPTAEAYKVISDHLIAYLKSEKI